MTKLKIGIILFLIFVSHLIGYEFPNYWANKYTPSRSEFTRVTSYFDAWDINVYKAVIKRANTEFTFSNPFTTEKSFMNLYFIYTLSGKTFPSTAPETVYFYMTIFSRLIFISSTFYILKNLLSLKYAVFGTFLLPLVGGFGWLIRSSADLQITPFTLVGAYDKPHELFAISCMLLSYWHLIVFFEKQEFKSILFASIWSVLVIAIYPFYSVNFAIFLFVLFITLYTSIKRKGSFVLFLTYYGVVLFLAAFIQGKLFSHSISLQSVLQPNLPPISTLSLILGYGPFIPFICAALVSIITERKRNNYIFGFLVIVLIHIALFYSPLSFSRYYLRGLLFFLLSISMILLSHIKKSYKNSLLVIFTLFVTFTSMYILARRITLQYAPLQWYYLSHSQNEVLNFLTETSQPNTGVLATFPFSNFIPAKTLNTVYMGHPYQTPQAEGKYERQTKFYKGLMTEDEAKDFLIKNNILHIVWPRSEKIKHYSFLQEIFITKDYSILINN